MAPEVDEAIRAARVVGASLGAFISTLLVTMPASIEQAVRSQQLPEGKSAELARWIYEMNGRLADVLSRSLPPETVAKMAEDLIEASKSLTAVLVEVAKVLGDPQVAEVVRRTSEGFKKSLSLLSSPDITSVMRALSDPDVLYAAGVLLAALKALGVAVRATSSSSLQGTAGG